MKRRAGQWSSLGLPGPLKNNGTKVKRYLGGQLEAVAEDVATVTCMHVSPGVNATPRASGQYSPNAVQSLVPGYESVAMSLMKRTIANNGVASIPELRELCVEADVKMIGCQMTVEWFGFDPGGFMNGIEYGGAATFFEFSGETDICLFI